MSFQYVAADDYDRFMGRFSAPLAYDFADLAGIDDQASTLDVGCGTGAMTAVLVERLGAEAVTAVDPSEAFVAATAERFPGIRVLVAAAEQLPLPTAAFDATVSELVVRFLADPAAGAAEMVRVTRPGGTVAACVWDAEHDRTPHAVFLRAVREVTGVDARARRVGNHAGDLSGLWTDAGCRDVTETELTVRVGYDSFEQWWQQTTRGMAAAMRRRPELDERTFERVRERTAEILGTGPFEITATAWAARGTVR